MRHYVTLISILAFSAAHAEHTYENKDGKQVVPDDIFDASMDCGLNLSKLDACTKAERSGTGQAGAKFCTDVKLYAGNVAKLMGINENLKKILALPAKEQAKKKSEKDQLVNQIKLFGELQKTWAGNFVKAGMSAEQVGKIPPLKSINDSKDFVCKKVK